MVRQTVAVKRGGYRLTITIPVEWWSGTDTIQTEKTRALRRARIRRYAKDKWRNLKTMRQAWKVERFLAVVTVSAPHGGSVFPARAAETVKPIIDAGSDVRLWDDDDSLHRHSTIYLQSPIEAPSGCYLLDILIIPISDENPQYQITGGLAASVVGMWRNVPMDERPAWYDGYEVRFSIPDRIWITSNYTDSDLQARQQGRRKADTWGRDDAFGVREKVVSQLVSYAEECWQRQPYCGYAKYVVIASVAYPYGVAQADPDNAAETVNAILKAGTNVGAWHGVTSDCCKGVAFVRSKNLNHGGRHLVRLLVFPVPDGFQMLDAIADSADASWAEHDRRAE